MVERGQIDKGLDRRAGLTLGLSGAVELVAEVVEPAHQGGDAGEEFVTTVLGADKLTTVSIQIREGKSVAKICFKSVGSYVFGAPVTAV